MAKQPASLGVLAQRPEPLTLAAWQRGMNETWFQNLCSLTAKVFFSPISDLQGELATSPLVRAMYVFGAFKLIEPFDRCPCCKAA